MSFNSLKYNIRAHDLWRVEDFNYLCPLKNGSGSMFWELNRLEFSRIIFILP